MLDECGVYLTSDARIWWNGGIRIGYVSHVLESIHEFSEWGLDEPTLMLRNCAERSCQLPLIAIPARLIHDDGLARPPWTANRVSGPTSRSNRPRRGRGVASAWRRTAWPSVDHLFEVLTTRPTFPHRVHRSPGCIELAATARLGSSAIR